MKARHRRFAWIGAGLVALGVAATLVLNAFQSNLVFFYTPISHVAMYIGHGQIVQASTYGQPVAVTELAYMPDFAGARRLT